MLDANVVAAWRLGLDSCGQIRILGVFSSLDITRKCTKTFPFPINSNVPPLVTETCIGNLSPLSSAHIRNDKPTCLTLLTQLILAERAERSARLGRQRAANAASATI